MRVTVNGKRSEVATGRVCLPERWNAAADRANGTKEEIRAFNAYLNDLTKKVYEAHRQLSEANLTITAESIKNKVTGKEDKPRLLIEIFKEHNQQLATLVSKGNYSKGTLTCFATALRHTRDFIKWKYKVDDFDVRHVDHTFVTDYDYFLRSQCNCQNNTAVKNMKNFGKIIRKCEASGWITISPFLNYKHTMKRVERIFLTTDELQLIIDKSFSTDRLTQVRDIFLFCCFTGLAFIDVQKLQTNKVVKGVDGEKWIQVNRQKTSTLAKIPLLPIPLMLIEKYANHPQCVVRRKVFPVLSNQKMNAYLKEIMDLCEIDKKVTFHTARHTFATTVTLLNGVPIETVSKMLGHTNLRITQHYAKMLDEKVGADMAILKSKLSENYPAKLKVL